MEEENIINPQRIIIYNKNTNFQVVVSKRTSSKYRYAILFPEQQTFVNGAGILIHSKSNNLIPFYPRVGKLIIAAQN